MKRYLCVVAFALLPLTASAQLRDALLTPAGSLYAIDIESAADHPDVVTESSHYLTLIVHDGERSTREIVPATLSRGDHSDPAIAYDSESGLLFLFWLRRSGLLYNELLLVTRDSVGTWSEPTVIAGSWNFREHLRIAVTRKVVDEESGAQFAGITAHAAWWELNSSTGEHSARYAMLTIHNGAIVEMTDLDLGTFIEGAETHAQDVQDDVLNQPLLQTSSLRDSVLVIFGDFATRSLHEVRIRPTRPRADVRIRIPIGRKERDFAAPRFDAASQGRVDAIYADNSGALALYVRNSDKLDYMILEDGAWTDARSIVLDSDVTGDVALAAVRRLVSGH